MLNKNGRARLGNVVYVCDDRGRIFVTPQRFKLCLVQVAGASSAGGGRASFSSGSNSNAGAVLPKEKSLLSFGPVAEGQRHSPEGLMSLAAVARVVTLWQKPRWQILYCWWQLISGHSCAFTFRIAKELIKPSRNNKDNLKGVIKVSGNRVFWCVARLRHALLYGAWQSGALDLRILGTTLRVKCSLLGSVSSVVLLLIFVLLLAVPKCKVTKCLD